MRNPAKLLVRAVISGSVASVTSSVALIFAAKLEDKAAAQPFNATSHWLYGEEAATVEGIDLFHTGTGYATHHAATIFWAMFFEGWIAARRPSGLAPLVKDALLMAAIAAAVDYGATPKRFTPGWEFVLSKKAMAAVYAALAAGLAAGAVLSNASPARARHRATPL